MLKRLFNNPVGLILTSATLLLVLSPEARRGTRKLLVKGAGTVLALGTQMKEATTGAVKQIGSIVEDAKLKQDDRNLPNLSKSVQDTGQAMKDGIDTIVQKTKAAFSDLGASKEPNLQTEQNQAELHAYNVMDNDKIKEKLNEIENQLH